MYNRFTIQKKFLTLHFPVLIFSLPAFFNMQKLQKKIQEKWKNKATVALK